ncbi:MAG TPA: hypothetical protein VFH51_20015, partial [Myxococcota bacterium]|nr:hypothetical protein [Myxococcota bacterium]
MLKLFLGGATPDPAGVPPVSDPVYGTLSCTAQGQPNCNNTYTVYIGAVQRVDQRGPTGKPVVITTVAMTPDDTVLASPSAAQHRFYADRLSRLEDLTGGSAVARYQADTAKACDPRDPTQAQADVLWVVDDSRSMQQIIGNLQKAATDAQAVLTANAGIVNFRVGMTTTNPANTGRTLCPNFCDAGCNTPGDCALSCADKAMGCIKQCTTPLSPNDTTACVQTTCSNGVCSCSNEAACAGGSNHGNCNPTGGTCVTPASLAAYIAAESTYALPGGGGSFYYEDTAFWDCDSSSQSQAQIPYIQSCGASPYNTGNFSSFYGPSFARKQLKANAGMLASDVNAACPTALLDLAFSTNSSLDTNVGCTDPTKCCKHLINTCSDGPTVLASQMCDLIRAMGGLPGIYQGFKTSGSRRHSAPEQGTRSARRLLQSMIPALPRDYDSATDPNHYDPATHLRLNCDTGPKCQVCDPSQDPNCHPVPLATVVLSDEEDFWFKDDCQPSASEADKQQLPADCRYVDGDPNTVEACTVSHCSQYSTGIPTGYNPDQAAANSEALFTLQWRDGAAAQCSASSATSCASDMCPGYGTQGTCQAHPECSWGGTSCRHRCSTYTRTDPGSLANAQAQKASCEADSYCRWDPSQVNYFGLQTKACVPKVLANDCLACKRYERNNDAVVGQPGLVGFGKVGPVYAIVRNKGQPGSGNWDGTNEDACRGGDVTWGRGDGQGYRDLAINTLGRTQDVCARDYSSFMKLVLADLAVLSKPYPLG